MNRSVAVVRWELLLLAPLACDEEPTAPLWPPTG